MIDFGTNNIYLAYIGLAGAAIGLSICLLYILPIQLKQVFKPNIRGTRIGLLALNLTLSLIFLSLAYTTFDRIFNDGEIGSMTSNFYRFRVGLGVFFIGILWLVIYRFGGQWIAKQEALDGKSIE